MRLLVHLPVVRALETEIKWKLIIEDEVVGIPAKSPDLIAMALMIFIMIMVRVREQ